MCWKPYNTKKHQVTAFEQYFFHPLYQARSQVLRFAGHCPRMLPMDPGLLWMTLAVASFTPPELYVRLIF